MLGINPGLPSDRSHTRLDTDLHPYNYLIDELNEIPSRYFSSARKLPTPGWHFDVDVYVKGQLPPKHRDDDHDRDDRNGKK